VAKSTPVNSTYWFASHVTSDEVVRCQESLLSSVEIIRLTASVKAVPSNPCFPPQLPANFVFRGPWRPRMLTIQFSSVADPGSGTFLTPGSGIRNRFIPDPTIISESLKPIFSWVKK
jgi:hypothetical protein